MTVCTAFCCVTSHCPQELCDTIAIKPANKVPEIDAEVIFLGNIVFTSPFCLHVIIVEK